jgi:hypothetical protein
LNEEVSDFELNFGPAPPMGSDKKSNIGLFKHEGFENIPECRYWKPLSRTNQSNRS